MRKRWIFPPFTRATHLLAQEQGIHPYLAQILSNRSIDPDAWHEFLSPQLYPVETSLLLPDIHLAVERIHRAVAQKEKIILFGDYDVDGVTSLTIFHEFLKSFEEDIPFLFYIPHRLEEGYGLNNQAIQWVRNQGARLLICFDCGTNSREEIELAHSLGIDTIVVDHHHPKKGANVPFAFINPQREDSLYPFKYLSSAGITYKFVQALTGKPNHTLLDLVALSIVCDVVPLWGENRALLNEGLKWLRSGERKALRILCEVSGVKSENIEPFHLGFILGPRINASGRMKTAHEALSLFLSQEDTCIWELARQLDKYNRKRRDVEKKVLREAERAISLSHNEFSAILVHQEGWHPGILGIVASRLADKYYRPAFVIGVEGEYGKGSVRSIESLDIMQVLTRCEDYLTSYGGHRKAAGIEIFQKNIEGFNRRLQKIVQESLSPQEFIPQITIDLEIPFRDLTLNFVRLLEQLKPFGEGNSKPLFFTSGVEVIKPFQKEGKRSLVGWIRQGDCILEARVTESSGYASILSYANKSDIVYHVEPNYYHESVTIIIKDVRICARD